MYVFACKIQINNIKKETRQGEMNKYTLFPIRNLKLGVALQFLKIYPFLGLKVSYEFLISDKIGRKLAENC